MTEAAAPPARRGLGKVFANFGWLAATRALSGVLSLGYLALATRALGVVDFGRFMLVLSAAQAIATFVQFQTWQVVIHYGVRHLAAGAEGRLARLIRACALLDLGSAAAGFAIAGASLWLAAAQFGLAGGLAWQAIAFSAALLLSIRSTPLGVLRLHDRFAQAAAADAVTPVVRLAGAAGAWALLPTVSGFLLAWGLAELVTAAACWWLAAGTGSLRPAAHVRLAGRVEAENPGYVRFVWATNAGSTLGLAGRQVATLVIGMFAGPVGAGQYRLAYQLAQSLTKVGQMLARAMFPELVRTQAAGAAFARMLRKLTVLTVATGALVLGALALAGGPLLRIVGGAPYEAALPLLLWLGAGACIDLAATTFEPALIAMGHAARAFHVRLAATLLLLALVAALLPVLGTRGAAIASFAGSAAGFVLLALAAWATLRHARSVPEGDVPPRD